MLLDAEGGEKAARIFGFDLEAEALDVVAGNPLRGKGAAVVAGAAFGDAIVAKQVGKGQAGEQRAFAFAQPPFLI